MKVTLIYTGHARTWKQCRENHKWQFWRHCDNVVTTASFVRDEDGEDAQKSGDFDWIELVDQPELKPTSDYENARVSAPFFPSVPTPWITRQLWHIKRGYEVSEARGGLIGADYVVRIRPDIWFQHSEPSFTRNILTPWWGTFGGVNDRLAICPAGLAGAYFKAFDNIESLIASGCPMHPESIMRASIGNLPWAPDLNCVFGTLRKGKDAHSFEMRQPEILLHELRS